MAMFATNTARRAATDGGLFARLTEAYQRYRIESRTYAELSALTDRDLADLDIHRSMIRQIAREAAAQA